MDSDKGTVFVIDDEAEVREGLLRLLRSAGLDVIAYETPQEFLANGPYESPGCILLDVNMPGMSGPELHSRLNESGISMPVIFLTGQANVSIGVHAMKHGAYDFLEKPVDADILLTAIERALHAYRKLQAEQLHLDDIQLRLAALSKREKEVLVYVIAGRLNKQIAGQLNIAEKTVKVHRGRAMAKMRCRSVAEVVHLCDELGFPGVVENKVS